DRLHDGGIVQLLRVVNLMTTGNSARVIVPNVFFGLANGPDHVPFHDLHMVNVVQQAEAGRTHLLGQLHAPLGAVVHVVLVIDLAVEPFHANGHLLFLGQADDVLQTQNAVFESFLVGHALPIARHADNIG